MISHLFGALSFRGRSIYLLKIGCAGAVCSGTRPGQKGATDGYNTRGTNPQGVDEPVGRAGASACPPAGKTGVEQRNGPSCQTSPPWGLCQRRGGDARGEC